MSEIPEGAKPTPEQALNSFLTLDRSRQLSWMQSALEAMNTAQECWLRDHRQAENYVLTHFCVDRYEDGWNDGLAELQRQFSAARSND